MDSFDLPLSAKPMTITTKPPSSKLRAGGRVCRAFWQFLKQIDPDLAFFMGEKASLGLNLLIQCRRLHKIGRCQSASKFCAPKVTAKNCGPLVDLRLARLRSTL